MNFMYQKQIATSKEALARISRLLIAVVMAVCVFSPAMAKDDEQTLLIMGRVRESIAHKDLVKATIYVRDSAGNHVDSLKSGGYYFGDASGNIEERAMFNFRVPKRKAIYNLEVVMPEYETVYRTVTIDHIGRREFTRTIDDIVMKRETRKLGEVTVTASKVKFYNRGDTIVFNADAFELAEGSMLDALVKQLPGVELREGGQIYVNGEYVENLLLNGKDFFKGNNELMLDNLASYTVKDIEVYKKASDADRWAGIKGKEDLTMDVKLKKEYNTGWMINIEGGAGTEDRYMGRAFVNRFTNNSRITLIGNVNNLNDNRKPGESTTWTPETNTAGTMKTQMGALDYNVQNSEGTWKVNGNTMVRHTSQDDMRNTDRMNFLTSGRTYDYSFNRNRSNNLTINTQHTFSMEEMMKHYLSANLNGGYSRNKNDGSNRSATFDNERPGITAGMIDSLYTASPSQINDLVNRVKTSTLSSSHSGNASFDVMGYKTINSANDMVMLTIDGSFNTSKNEVWRDYVINYGQNATPAVRENQYFDNSPNRNLKFGAGTGYRYMMSSHENITVTYKYNRSSQKKDSYMYALDRLEEMGIIGTLPEGYLTTFDASRSYRSELIENTHTVSLDYFKSAEDINIMIRPELKIVDRNFSYLRNGTNHKVDQTKVLLAMPTYSTRLQKSFGKYMFNNREQNHNRITLMAVIDPTLANPEKMVNIVDNNDPQNIWLGNPDLKPSMRYAGELSWQYVTQVRGRTLMNTLTAAYSNTHNALVNGYTYDTSTGVRTNKTYNVANGNYEGNLNENVYLQFGSRGQFTAGYNGSLTYTHAADMIGVDAAEPVKSSVETLWNEHNVNWNWDLGKKRTIGVSGKLSNRRTTSDRADFNAISATHASVTLRGQIDLVKGLALSTDFSIYMRRGYGSPELDTTDPVWNARLSYTPAKSKWVIMLDGFDMLHQLSNVNYAVNAQGRTITYTNVLPRYVMLHAQYRINIQPKKKIIDNKVRW